MAEGKKKEQQEEKQSGGGNETHRQTETDWRDTGQCETDMPDTNRELVGQRGWNGRGEDERATGRKTEGEGGRGHGRETHRQTETDWRDTGQCETDIADEND